MGWDSRCQSSLVVFGQNISHRKQRYWRLPNDLPAGECSWLSVDTYTHPRRRRWMLNDIDFRRRNALQLYFNLTSKPAPTRWRQPSPGPSPRVETTWRRGARRRNGERRTIQTICQGDRCWYRDFRWFQGEKAKGDTYRCLVDLLSESPQSQSNATCKRTELTFDWQSEDTWRSSHAWEKLKTDRAGVDVYMDGFGYIRSMKGGIDTNWTSRKSGLETGVAFGTLVPLMRRWGYLWRIMFDCHWQ